MYSTLLSPTMISIELHMHMHKVWTRTSFKVDVSLSRMNLFPLFSASVTSSFPRRQRQVNKDDMACQTKREEMDDDEDWRF